LHFIYYIIYYRSGNLIRIPYIQFLVSLSLLYFLRFC